VNKSSQKYRIVGMAMPFRARGLENQRGQLVERVDGLQAHNNERHDHQIKAKMHEGLATKIILAARGSRKVMNQNSNAHPQRTIARQPIRRQLEQKASAAAEAK
jgi:hypothetical protein